MTAGNAKEAAQARKAWNCDFAAQARKAWNCDFAGNCFQFSDCGILGSKAYDNDAMFPSRREAPGPIRSLTQIVQSLMPSGAPQKHGDFAFSEVSAWDEEALGTFSVPKRIAHTST